HDLLENRIHQLRGHNLTVNLDAIPAAICLVAGALHPFFSGNAIPIVDSAAYPAAQMLTRPRGTLLRNIQTLIPTIDSFTLEVAVARFQHCNHAIKPFRVNECEVAAIAFQPLLGRRLDANGGASFVNTTHNFFIAHPNTLEDWAVCHPRNHRTCPSVA